MIDIFDPYFQWSVVLALCMAAWCCKWVLPRFGWNASALLLFMGLSAIYVWEWKENRYLNVDVYNQMALRFFAADSLLKLLVIIVPLMIFIQSCREKYFETLQKIVIGYISVNSFWVVVSYVYTGGCHVTNTCGGLHGNPSIGASLIVCMLPIAVRSWRKQWLLIGFAILSVIISKSSIALGLLAIYGAITILRWKPWLVFASAIPLVLGALILGPHELMNDSNRFVLWKTMMLAWDTPKNILFGTGFGTYHVFSINIQGHFKLFDDYHWMAMHNSWLQQLFSGGVVGAALMISTYTVALVKMLLTRELQVAISILLFGAFMLLNPALEMPYTSLFAGAIFVYALNKNTLHTEQIQT